MNQAFNDEVQKRREDIALLAKDEATLRERLVNGEDIETLGAELVQLVGLIAQHLKRIKAILEDEQIVEVVYKKKSLAESVRLPPGVFVRIPITFFDPEFVAKVRLSAAEKGEREKEEKGARENQTLVLQKRCVCECVCV